MPSRASGTLARGSVPPCTESANLLQAPAKDFKAPLRLPSCLSDAPVRPEAGPPGADRLREGGHDGGMSAE